MKGFLNKVQRRPSNPGSEGNVAIVTETAQAAASLANNPTMPFADMSDVVLPTKHTKDPRRYSSYYYVYIFDEILTPRRASFSKKSKSGQLKELPPLNDTPMQKREVSGS